MPACVTSEEFEARVGVLEREVEGEKLVTRHILEQTRHNGDDRAAIKTRLGRIEEKIDSLDRKVDSLDRSRTWLRACRPSSETLFARSGASALANETAESLASRLPIQ